MNRIKTFFMQQWRAPYGFRDVLRISLPLIFSMCSHTVMLFTDRLFLGRYSLDALAAATPAGILAHTLCCFFIGIVSFTNTFVAQYTGAGRERKVGAVLWHALYFSLAGGALLAVAGYFSDAIFAAAGHDRTVAEMESVYFRILMWGGGIALAQTALECFYSGRGFTKIIMAVNIAGMAINVPLDYALIFGRWGFPELGIAGSAIATVLSHVTMAVMLAAAAFTPANIQRFGFLVGLRPDFELFRRLFRFGVPVGIQFFTDMISFSFFILIVGRLGRDALAATNMAFALNSLVFMPMLGFGIAVSTLVGQALGAGKPHLGEQAVRSTFILTCSYMWTVAFVFAVAPGPLCDFFRSPAHDPAEFARIRSVAVVLLRFVAFYSVLDTANVVYSGALKGAGDTRFIGWTLVILSLCVMLGPVWIAVVRFGAGIYTAWSFATLYTCLLAVIFYLRFRSGKWKTYRVIEPPPPALEPAGPALHAVTD